MQNKTSIAAEKRVSDSYPLVSVQAAVILILTSVLPAVALCKTIWLSPVSWMTIIVSAASIFILSKRFLYIFPVVFAVFLFSSSPITTALVAVILGSAAAVGIGAYSLSRGGFSGGLLSLLPFAASYGIALLITGDPIISLSALFLLPILLCAGIAAKVSLKLSTVAVTVAVAVCTVAAAIIAADFCFSFGYLNVELIKSSVSAAEDMLVRFFEEAMVLMEVEITGAVTSEIRNMVSAYINMMPGIVGALALLFGYAVCSFFRISARYCNVKSIFITEKLRITSLTALLFVAAHIVSFTTDASGNLSLAAIAASNIALILLPPLIIVAVRAIAALPKKLGIFGLILGIGVIFLVFSSSIYVLALVGTAYTLVINIDEWAKDHYSKGGKENGQ